MLESLRKGIQSLPAGQFFYGIVFYVLPILFAVYALSPILVPCVVAIVISYIILTLQGELNKKGLPERASMFFVMLGLFVLISGVLFFLAPLIWEQSAKFTKEVPSLYADFRVWITEKLSLYIGVESKDVVTNMFNHFGDGIAGALNILVNNTFGSLLSVASISLYVVLVPVLVFFMVRDDKEITAFISRFIPTNVNKGLIAEHWRKLDKQLGNYIKGKLLEVIIIGAFALILFVLLGLKYAVLLATAVGLSVLIPFVGAFVVTIPVLAVGFSQWGFTDPFFFLAISYVVLQVVDGNLLVPLIFSETMDMHPIAIILAVLVFGALGGIAGVFFAIPLLAAAKIFIDLKFPST